MTYWLLKCASRVACRALRALDTAHQAWVRRVGSGGRTRRGPLALPYLNGQPPDTFCPYCVLAFNLAARGLGDRRYVGLGRPVICDEHILVTLRQYASRRPYDA